MRAGQLDKLITVQESTTGRDAYGGVTDSWATFAQYWARLEYLGGAERMGSDQVRGDVEVQFTVRHDPSVSRLTPDMRVSWNSRTFDIEAVFTEGEQGREARIITVERGAGA